MPPRMTTRSVGRPAAASRGEGMGGRAGKGGGRTRSHFGDQGDGRIDGQGGQEGGQGSEVNDGVNGVPDFSIIVAQQNQNGDAINDNIQGDVRNVIENNDRRVQDMSGCGDNQKVKYTVGSFVGKALTWWNSQIPTLGREVVV
nr:reverse transcriptase domain-containing protein [Tanacetum cinerariifolium]